MPTFDLLLKDGKIFDGERLNSASMGIKDGKIVFIGDPMGLHGQREIDLCGAWVLPGGIETHTHIREPELTPRSDFQSESVAAAAGGITTFFEMPISAPPQWNTSILRRRAELAEKKSCVDFGFYGAAGGGAQNVAELARAGVVGFKVFLFGVTGPRAGEFEKATATDDAALMDVMEHVAATGKILAVHAENGSLAAHFTRRVMESGGARDLYAHGAARPALCETEAVMRLLRIARTTGTRLSFCHISSRAALEEILKARRDGQEVYIESCPQYLWLNEDTAVQWGPYAKYNPPIRTEDDRRALFEQAQRGNIDYIGSDHGAFRLDEKLPGENDIFKAPAGSVGFETRLPLMVTSVLNGELTLKQAVRLMTTRAAEVFRLLPRKGALRIGADADIAVVDPNARVVPSPDASLSRGKEVARLYEGWQLRGKVLHTLVRGEFVWHDGAPVPNMAGWGKNICS